jgi:hypothetical protein
VIFILTFQKERKRKGRISSLVPFKNSNSNVLFVTANGQAKSGGDRLRLVPPLPDMFGNVVSSHTLLTQLLQSSLGLPTPALPHPTPMSPLSPLHADVLMKHSLADRFSWTPPPSVHTTSFKSHFWFSLFY